jgi:outer membrane protein assembly factor BamA
MHRPYLVNFLLAGALAGCAGGASNVVRGDSLAARVELVGNAAFSAETLRKVVTDIQCDPEHALEAITAGLVHGTVADCKSLDDFARTIEVFYTANGYVTAKAKPSTDEKTGQPLVIVEEGALFSIGAVDIAEVGAAPAKDELGDPAKLKAVLSLQAGEPFLRRRVWEGMEAVRRRYDAAGYGLANLTPVVSIHADERKVDLRVEVERGQIYKIGAIDIVGGRATPEAKIREMLALRVGDVYNSAQKAEAKKRLAASGLFRDVEIRVESNAAGGAAADVRVIVEVEEATP